MSAVPVSETVIVELTSVGFGTHGRMSGAVFLNTAVGQYSALHRWRRIFSRVRDCNG